MVTLAHLYTAINTAVRVEKIQQKPQQPVKPVRLTIWSFSETCQPLTFSTERLISSNWGHQERLQVKGDKNAGDTDDCWSTCLACARP